MKREVLCDCSDFLGWLEVRMLRKQAGDVAARSCQLTTTGMGHASKTRHQKRTSETAGRNVASIVEIPHTETSSYLRNHAVPRSFERPQYGTRRRPDWLAGAAEYSRYQPMGKQHRHDTEGM